MNELKTAETDLKSAQRTLAELQAELPNFEKLVSDNEQTVDRLKAERASLDDQVEVRTRVTVAREMLEQHHSDIANAQAEVERFEGNAERERGLAEMTQHAIATARYHGEFQAALEVAHADLAEHAEKLAVAWLGLIRSRSSFATAGRPLSAMFNRTGPGTPAEKLEARGVLDEVRERGADPTFSLTRYDGREHSGVDLVTSPHELRYPQPFGEVLLTALETQLRQRAE